MKQIIGAIMFAAGIAFGLYAGIWWSFIGGLVDVIVAVRAEELVAIDVATGIAKVMFSGIIGWVCAAVLVIPGLVLLDSR